MELDLRGLKCPLPVLKTRAVLTRLAPGQTLNVTTTDPLARIDLPNLLRETGDELLQVEANGAVATYVIRKS